MRNTVRLRAQGPLACFTQPAFKAERVSYPVLTPSAARGLVECVLWKPEIRWHVHKIAVLSPIQWFGYTVNEVKDKASLRTGRVTQLVAEESRVQRSILALRDVDYVVEASLTLTPRAGAGDNEQKYLHMFTRRLEAGQVHRSPCFGFREMMADLMPADGAPDPIPETMDIGEMLLDIDFGDTSDGKRRPTFFHAQLERGVLHVPPMRRRGEVVRRAS